jgi:16S rRNA processing protein RimM
LSGSRPRTFAELVTIGRVVKPQGRKGEVVVESLTDRPDRFPQLDRAYVAGPRGGARPIDVVSCWPHKGRFVLKIDGVDTIDQAEEYRGLEIRIGEEELAALPEGSYYHHEILGLRVVDASGRPLGLACDLFETGAGAPVLVVRGEVGETLLPLATEFVEVDVPRGRIVARVPEYLDDAPGTRTDNPRPKTRHSRATPSGLHRRRPTLHR